MRDLTVPGATSSAAAVSCSDRPSSSGRRARSARRAAARSAPRAGRSDRARRLHAARAAARSARRRRRPADRRRLRASFATICSSQGRNGSPSRKRPSARHALTRPPASHPLPRLCVAGDHVSERGKPSSRCGRTSAANAVLVSTLRRMTSSCSSTAVLHGPPRSSGRSARYNSRRRAARAADSP